MIKNSEQEYINLKKLYDKKLKGGMKKNHLRKAFVKEVNNPIFDSSNLSNLFFEYYKKDLLDCSLIYFKIFPEILNKKAFYLNIINNPEDYIDDKFINFLVDYKILKDENKINSFIEKINTSPENVYSYKERLSFENSSYLYASFIKKGFDIDKEIIFDFFGGNEINEFLDKKNIDNIEIIIKSKKNNHLDWISRENYSLKKYKNNTDQTIFLFCFLDILNKNFAENQNTEIFDIIKKNLINEDVKKEILNLKLKNPLRISVEMAKFLKDLNLNVKEIEEIGFVGYKKILNIIDFDYYYKNNFDMNLLPESHFLKDIDSPLILKDVFEYLLKSHAQSIDFNVVVKKENKRSPEKNLEKYLYEKINSLSLSLINWNDTQYTRIELIELNEKLLSILVDKMRLIDRIQINEELTKSHIKRL